MSLTGVKTAKRNITADVFKAICIFLVIAGHAPLCNNHLKQFVYAFHMPAFFLVYGLLYNTEKHASRGFLTKGFLTDKVRRLLVPGWITGLIYSLFSSTGFSIKTIPLILWGSQRSFAMADSLTSLWFLPCMFLSVIGFELLMDFRCRKKSPYLMVLIMFILTVLSVCLPSFKYGYPFSVDAATMGIVLIWIGHISAALMKKLTTLETLKLLVISLVAAVICFFLNRLNLNFISINNADMAGRHFGNILLYLICGCSGSLSVYLIAECISRSGLKLLKQLLEFTGKYTLSILLVHKPLVTYACQVMSSLPVQKSIIGLLAAVVIFLLCAGVMKLIQKTAGEAYLV